jgi:hypothetical protein
LSVRDYQADQGDDQHNYEQRTVERRPQIVRENGQHAPGREREQRQASEQERSPLRDWDKPARFSRGSHAVVRVRNHPSI